MSDFSKRSVKWPALFSFYSSLHEICFHFQHRLSLNSSGSPRLNPEPPSRRHTSQLTHSLTSPRYDLPLRAQTEGASLHHKRSYSDEFRLPVLRCVGAGETSLTVNAELLQDPKWNDYISAWVSGKKVGPLSGVLNYIFWTAMKSQRGFKERC